MFARSLRTPVMFDADDGGGGDAPVADAPVADAPVADAPVADAPVVADPNAPVDYAAKVAEWGGDEAIARALQIDKALDTTEGQEALVVQHLQLRGFSSEQIEAFLRPPAAPAAEGEESVADLLKDPDRQLTAGEIQRVLEAREQTTQQAQTQREQTLAIQSSITATLTKLEVPKENAQTILTLADQFMPTPGTVANDPDVIEAAITKGKAEFDRQVQEEAKRYVEGKGAAHEKLPQPLPTGGTGGTETPTEPQSVAEASERVRNKLLSK